MSSLGSLNHPGAYYGHFGLTIAILSLPRLHCSHHGYPYLELASAQYSHLRFTTFTLGSPQLPWHLQYKSVLPITSLGSSWFPWAHHSQLDSLWPPWVHHIHSSLTKLTMAALGSPCPFWGHHGHSGLTTAKLAKP